MNEENKLSILKVNIKRVTKIKISGDESASHLSATQSRKARIALWYNTAN
jgi:hypothetical protein